MTLIERLRQPVLHYATCHEAADLIEQQAARIAELEEKLKAEYIQHKRWQMACADAKGELSDLRQRINEAPVVAWKYQWDKGSDIWPHKLQGAELFDFIPDPHTVHPLISKEDLQK